MVLKEAVAYDIVALDAIMAMIEEVQRSTTTLLDVGLLGMRKRDAWEIAVRLYAATALLVPLLTDPTHVGHLQTRFADERPLDEESHGSD